MRLRLFLLVILAAAIACNMPWQSTSITIGCDVDELIDAINTANADSQPYNIFLDPGCDYKYFAPENQTGGYGDNALPAITSSITIKGDDSTISRAPGPPYGTTPDFRFFFVTGEGWLTLNDVTVTNGSDLDIGSYEGGGAIYNDHGRVTIRNSSLTLNAAESEGGAIYNLSGTVVVNDNSLLKWNDARNGGAILSYGSEGSVTVNNSIFELNDAMSLSSTDTFGGKGGAIAASGSLIALEEVQFLANDAKGGGAIHISNQGVLEASGCTFTDNRATFGGGVYIMIGTGYIEDSHFESNSAMFGGGLGTASEAEVGIVNSVFEGNEATWVVGDTHDGGGIYNGGELEILNTTFHANSATQNGGGIHNWGLLSVHDSTFYENSAGANGGGLTTSRPTTIVNSTFSANDAGSSGGGIYAVESDLGASKPNIWLTNLTIAFNAASNGGGMYFGNVLMHVRNNIIAETLSGGDCVQGAGSSITQHGENLDTDNSCPTFSIMASPMLGLLTDNGGSTLTHALNLGSPAIDVVSNCTEMPIGSPLTEDQRGVSRPQPTGGICDLGAFEFELQQASLRLSPEPSEDLTAMATTTVTRAVPELAPFVEAITPANCRSGPGTVYDVVSALDEGQTASAIGSNAANTWTLVEISETIDPCWVSNSTVELNIDPARLEVFQDPPTPTATSRPPTATFTPTSQPPTATFTPEPLGSITGHVWKDSNADGSSQGEDGYPGVTVHLGQGACSSSGHKTTTTAGDGSFTFGNLPEGTYCVTVDVPLVCAQYSVATTSTERTIIISPGESIDAGWFGFAPYVC